MKKALLRAALLAAMISVGVPAGAAGAATLATADPAGDVWRSTFDPGTEEETLEPAGTQPNVDLVRTKVVHGASRVVFKARYADLRRSTNRFFFAAELRTNEGLRRDVWVETTMRWSGDSALLSRRGEARCRGLRHDIDYARETVTLSVPRDCLSKPRWVQARMGAFAFPEDFESNDTYLDSASDDTADEPAWSARVRRG
ncbi:MAG: hypothetical protein ACLGH4_07585 [Actinomycetes bacterium]